MSERLSLDRRTAIARTPAGGGSAVTTSYLWCGSAVCQARDATNDVTREYYAEGELVPGTPPQTLYYGPDQIGSVRRVFASASSAPAYSYDPYGVPLQATAPLTDFTYAGMFHDTDSGLDLTLHRAYDPVAGRWLSRDPLGEASDPVGNLYLYVGGNPISLIDPIGLCSFWDIIRSNPSLLLAIAATEALGGGPENPLADALVVAEVEAFAAVETTTLYRAVGPEELEGLAGGGQYSPSPGGLESKYFYPTPEQAGNYAANPANAQSGPYTLTSTKVPTSMIRSENTVNVAGEGKIVTIPNEELSNVPSPTVYNSTPVPTNAR